MKLALALQQQYLAVWQLFLLACNGFVIADFFIVGLIVVIRSHSFEEDDEKQ